MRPAATAFHAGRKLFARRYPGSPSGPRNDGVRPDPPHSYWQETFLIQSYHVHHRFFVGVGFFDGAHHWFYVGFIHPALENIFLCFRPLPHFPMIGMGAIHGHPGRPHYPPGHAAFIISDFSAPCLFYSFSDLAERFRRKIDLDFVHSSLLSGPKSGPGLKGSYVLKGMVNGPKA